MELNIVCAIVLLMGEFPNIRDINSVGEGKRRALLVDFVKSCWGNLRSWATYWGTSGAVAGSFSQGIC